MLPGSRKGCPACGCPLAHAAWANWLLQDYLHLLAMKTCLQQIPSQTLLTITCVVGASCANSPVTLQGSAWCLGSSSTWPSDSVEREAG